ncbi:MAG TPA: hypothetical protein VK489_06260 [Ferruginibacter sp.]|nr:hypothetical protein [Ferruginibacter sp.]
MEENKNIQPELPEEFMDNSSSFMEAPAPEQPSNALNDPNELNHNMEVHHHTHPAHGKKTWKEYFWEFLMLFLAVFCGFLAEYQLEHKIEKDRELQFIRSLATDLEDDVKSLDAMIGQEHDGIKSLDTLINLLNDPLLAKQHGDDLYYVARIGPRSIPFANNSRTFDQLKNSGGFRLIRKTEASNNIMGYYNQFSWIRLLEDNYNHEFDNFKHIAAKILDPVILRKQEADKGNIERSNDNPSLRTYDIEMLKEMAFHTVHMNGSRRSKLLLFEKLKKSAEALNDYLKKEYHLD